MTSTPRPADPHRRRARRPPPRPIRWRGWLTVLLALVWLYGLGSLLAVVLAVHWRRTTPDRYQRRPLTTGLVLGAAGLAATIALVALMVTGS